MNLSNLSRDLEDHHHVFGLLCCRHGYLHVLFVEYLTVSIALLDLTVWTILRNHLCVPHSIPPSQNVTGQVYLLYLPRPPGKPNAYPIKTLIERLGLQKMQIETSPSQRISALC